MLQHGHNAKCNEPVTRGQITVQFHYRSYLEKLNPKKQNTEWWLPGADIVGEVGRCYSTSAEFLFSKMKKF